MVGEKENPGPGPAETTAGGGLVDLKRSLDLLAGIVPTRYRTRPGASRRKAMREEWSRTLSRMSDHALTSALGEFTTLAERVIVLPTIRRRLEAGPCEMDREGLKQDTLLEFILKIPDLLWAPNPVGLMYRIAEQAFIDHYRRGRVLKAAENQPAAGRGSRRPEKRYVRRQVPIGDHRTVAVHPDQDLGPERESRRRTAIGIAAGVAEASHPDDKTYARLCRAVVEALWDGSGCGEITLMRSGRPRRRRGRRTNCLSHTRIGRLLIARGDLRCCARTAGKLVREAMADLARSEDLRRLLHDEDLRPPERFLARLDSAGDYADRPEAAVLFQGAGT